MANATIYWCGSNEGWTAKPTTEFTTSDGETYTHDLAVNGDLYFAIADGQGENATDWDNFNTNYRYSYGENNTEVSTGTNYVLTKGGNRSMKFTGDGSTYRFTFVLSTKTLTITKVDYATIGSVQLVGGFNEWSSSTGLITLTPKSGETNVYECEVDWSTDMDFQIIANTPYSPWAYWMKFDNISVGSATPAGWITKSDEEYGNLRLNHSLASNYLTYTITATWTPNSIPNSGWTIDVVGKDLKPNATIGTVKLAGSFNSWKGEDKDCIILSKVGDTNVYTCDIDTWTDDTEFKFIANDLWMGYTNVEGGDITITAPDGWVVNSGEYGNFLLKHSSLPTHYLSYTITATWTPSPNANQGWAIEIAGKTAEPKNVYTVTFVDGKKWGNVSAYVWNETGGVVVITDPYPGNSLDEPTGTRIINGEELNVYTYSYETYDDAPEKIIFNDGTNSDVNKTADLAFVNGKQYTETVTFIPVYAVLGSNEAQNNKLFFASIWGAGSKDYLTESSGTWTKTFSNVEITAQKVIYKVAKYPYLEATEVETWYPAGDNAELNISEDGTYHITFTFNGTSASHTYIPATETFNVTEAGWATAKTTYAVDFTGVVGLEAYTATVDETTVTLHKQGVVPANTPLVLKGITKAVPTVANNEADAVTNSLKWYDNYDVNDTYAHVYGLAKDDDKARFARVNNGTKITSKAILEFINPTSSREFLDVVFEDETTGISQIENAQPANVQNGAIYNLNGQRVMNPGKGLYIVNGKKVIMK